MNTHLRNGLLTCALALSFTGSAFAQAITPTYNTFGSLAGATFNGTAVSSGIPNDAVAITTIGGVTLGLTAHARYTNPVVGNNGAGTFYATPGPDTVSPSPHALEWGPDTARWNFGFYFGGTVTDYNYRMYYDFNPAVGNSIGDHGSLSLPATYMAPSSDSWNLGMDFLATSATHSGVFPLVAPSYGAFNPSSNGEYTFAIVAYDKTVDDGFTSELGRSAITVAVPEPETYAMMLAGLALMGWVARRRRQEHAPAMTFA